MGKIEKIAKEILAGDEQAEGNMLLWRTISCRYVPR